MTLPLLAPGRAGGHVVARAAARTRSPTTRSACSPSGGSPTCARSTDPSAALHQRAEDFAPGDTDLAWTRLTPWRVALASAFDGVRRKPHVGGRPRRAERAVRPAAVRLAGAPGWTSRPRSTAGDDEPVSGVEISFADGKTTTATLEDTSLVLRREGQQDSFMPFGERPLGELLAEELRRLDHDHVYAEALSQITGIEGLEERSPHRTHIWWDPAEHEAAS